MGSRVRQRAGAAGTLLAKIVWYRHKFTLNELGQSNRDVPDRRAGPEADTKTNEQIGE